MEQQTAVEWFLQELIRCGWFEEGQINITLEQAKQMEKERIIEFGKKVADHWGMTEVPQEYIEQYYNETY